MKITRRVFVVGVSSMGIAASFAAGVQRGEDRTVDEAPTEISLTSGRAVQVLNPDGAPFEFAVPREIVVAGGAAAVGGAVLLGYDSRIFTARDTAVVVAGSTVAVVPVAPGPSPGLVVISLSGLKARTDSVARELRIATPLEWRLDEFAGPFDDPQPIRVVSGEDALRELTVIPPTRLSTAVGAWELLAAATWDRGAVLGDYPFPVAVRLCSSGPAPVPPCARLIVELDARLFEPSSVDYVDYRTPDAQGRSTNDAATARHRYEVTASPGDSIARTIVEFGEGFPVGATWDVVLRTHPRDAVAVPESAPAYVAVAGPSGEGGPLISGSTGFQSRQDG